MDNKIEVFVGYIDKDYCRKYLDKTLKMNTDFSKRITKMKQEENKLQTILGRVLLSKAFGGVFEETIEDNFLRYSKYGKPSFNQYIPNSFEFSISHSLNMVILAKSSQKVGIDIEHNHIINTNNIVKMFAPEEQYYICTECSEKGISTSVLEIWTSKEAILKLLGYGLYINLNNVVIDPKNRIGTVEFDNWQQTFKLERLKFDYRYTCTLATPITNNEITVVHI